MFAKRGRFDLDHESLFGSAAPSEYGDDGEERGTFAVPRGRALRAVKKMTPLSGPGVAMGSVTSQDDNDQNLVIGVVLKMSGNEWKSMKWAGAVNRSCTRCNDQGD